MPRYVLSRVLQALVVLWAAFTASFAILYLLPSDPLQLQLGAAGVQEDSLSPAELAQPVCHSTVLSDPIALVVPPTEVVHGDDAG